MTIHVLVEGPSERALLERWAPRLLQDQVVKVHPHQGKGRLPKDSGRPPLPRHRGLLDQLPAKLRGFATSLNVDADRVVVLVDADDEDVPSLYEDISEVVRRVSKALRVVVAIAVEETEAFYLGDLRALKAGFPNADMKQARAYVPDSICGTWELFGRIVGDGGGDKVAWAETIGPLLTTNERVSRSPSFRKLLMALNELSPEPLTRGKPARGYRHPPKQRSDSSRRR